VTCRAGVAVAPPAAETFDGFDALTSTDCYSGASSAFGGSTAGFYVQFWMSIEDTAVSATRIFLGNYSGGATNNGWGFLTQTTNATLTFACKAATTSFAPSYTFSGADIGRAIHVCGAMNGSGTVTKLWVDGVATGTTAIGTYAPSTGPIEVGRRTSTASSAGGLVRVLGGVSYGTFIPTDAEVFQACADGLAAGDVVAIPAKVTAQWSFKGLGSAVSTITPTVGAVNLTKSGSPTYVTGVAP
jgi:hypothetical protein